MIGEPFLESALRPPVGAANVFEDRLRKPPRVDIEKRVPFCHEFVNV